MSVDTLTATYNNDRIAIGLNETTFKMAALVQQLNIAAESGLLSDAQVPACLHAASHNAATAAEELKDAAKKRANQRFSDKLAQINAEIWKVHTLVDRIVTDAQRDANATWLTDPPNHAELLNRLSQKVQEQLDRLSAIKEKFERDRKSGYGATEDGVPVYVILMVTCFVVALLAGLLDAPLIAMGASVAFLIGFAAAVGDADRRSRR